jgi:hypothetical protein
VTHQPPAARVFSVLYCLSQKSGDEDVDAAQLTPGEKWHARRPPFSLPSSCKNVKTKHKINMSIFTTGNPAALLHKATEFVSRIKIFMLNNNKW